MKKRLINHALNDIAYNQTRPYIKPATYYVDGHYLICNDNRIMETEQPIDSLEIVNGGYIAELCKGFLEDVNDAKKQYYRSPIYDIEYMKNEVMEKGGRRGVVLYRHMSGAAMNARFVMKAMKALNAKYCYIPYGDRRAPILICENDDPQSMNRELILPCNNYDNRVGFWAA